MSEVEVDVNQPVIIGIQFSYSETGQIGLSLEYYEPREQIELAQTIHSTSFPSSIRPDVEDEVDEILDRLVRVLDAVNEEKRRPPATIPSRRRES